MLVEALRSIHGADVVMVVDDGSDFDVRAVAEMWAGSILLGPRKSPEERMRTPSCGALINQGLQHAVDLGADYAAVLSDDDLLAPGWLEAAGAYLDDHPEKHMVAGKWAIFNDGEQPDPTKLCPISFPLPLTAGNFVYRLSCATEEDCWWQENSLAVHDGAMLTAYCQVHRTRRNKAPWLGVLPIMAGYRREHPKTVSRHSVFGGDQYTPDVAVMFTEGSME
jgi:glycosyltransferase involved in cell wall biosynthesis